MEQKIQQTLKLFIKESLFDATTAFLLTLGVQVDRETAEPIDVADLYDDSMPKYLTDALQGIENTYFIGVVNDLSLSGTKSSISLNEVAEKAQHYGKYDGMFVFACDAKPDTILNRTSETALTRAFNRVASENPVILVIRQGECISLSTIERTDSQKGGEKMGKVSILRNINCKLTHRGHLDILESLGSKKFGTFEALYKHWMEVFSSELLTKKFYSELSDWYAWASQIVKFPNNIDTTTEEGKKKRDAYIHESCIRLITRLIFVWFLKQKKNPEKKGLIPEEFFDETYIRENLIDNFNPHVKDDSAENSSASKYYRLVLQNLFFAMLNCPIVEEGKNVANNRRFCKPAKSSSSNNDSNISHLMRYEKEFKEGGAKRLLQLANSNVPFLNGGLFDCLDDEQRRLFYDGFSEQKESLEQLFLPDYLFFGNEVGKDIDLSKWYGDKNKKHVSVRGLIDILSHYSFTVEENTPLDQEVSLDPELLGKVFENLLATFNPETSSSARKQTGSFYTPREIVQYMVNESLVAHLKRMCGDELEPDYRQLLDYSTNETRLNTEQRKQVMKAIYNCRVLDPACGSGAFPMGMLQQTVHVLRQLDPTNEMWKDFMIDIAIEQSRKAFKKNEEEERKARLADIENAFNQNVNDPDYARKLYLIEHCIYGVDIQPIATQISKLRFFISLVVDQKPTTNSKDNFGIRPLPNLESKFVAANTLIPLDASRSLFTSSDDIQDYEEQLHELNHKLFLAKRNKDKHELRQKMVDVRRMMAQSLENLGAIGSDGFKQLTEWDMFNQNVSASFFNPEWMFGVNDGFDVVIGNPPYIKEYTNKSAFDGFREQSPYYMGKMDLWYGFACHGLDFLQNNGVLCFIAQNNWTTSGGAKKMRRKVVEDCQILQMLDFNTYMVFESADIQTMIMLFKKDAGIDDYPIDYRLITQGDDKKDMIALLEKKPGNTKYMQPIINREKYHNRLLTFSDNESILDKIADGKTYLKDDEVAQGIVFPQDFLNKKSSQKLGNRFPVGTGIFGLTDDEKKQLSLTEKEKELIQPYYTTEQIQRYYTDNKNTLWLIYTDSSFKKAQKMKDYPNLKTHLDKFLSIFTSDNRPYGLHRCRNQHFFQSEKVISLRKCVERPCFSYSSFDCYVTQTFFIIQSNRWNMKFLTGLLNSKLIEFWLRNKGKMQGNNYQVDKEPLQGIPLPLPEKCTDLQTPIIKLVDDIILKLANNSMSNIKPIEESIDFLVYHLYDLTYDEVLIIDPKTPITREKYDNFTTK